MALRGNPGVATVEVGMGEKSDGFVRKQPVEVPVVTPFTCISLSALYTATQCKCELPLSQDASFPPNQLIFRISIVLGIDLISCVNTDMGRKM